MLSEERLAEIRAMMAGCECWAPEFQRDAQAYKDLLAEHDRLVAEVERLTAEVETLRPDAALGRAAQCLGPDWELWRCPCESEGYEEYQRWYVLEHGQNGEVKGSGETLVEALGAAGLRCAAGVELVVAGTGVGGDRWR